MTAIQTPTAPRAVENRCADCRFGAGLPQGPRRLMRCVDPGTLTAGQFLRGPQACESFQARETSARGAGARTAIVHGEGASRTSVRDSAERHALAV